MEVFMRCHLPNRPSIDVIFHRHECFFLILDQKLTVITCMSTRYNYGQVQKEDLPASLKTPCLSIDREIVVGLRDPHMYMTNRASSLGGRNEGSPATLNVSSFTSGIAVD